MEMVVDVNKRVRVTRLALVFCLRCDITHENAVVLHTTPPVSRFVDIRSESGMSPLHFAVWYDQVHLVQVLASRGADLIVKSSCRYCAEL